MMDRNKLGMILFVVSESIFFALLILAYVFYHRTSGEGAAAAKMLDPMKTGAFSIALLSSSATVWGAERQRRRKSGIGAGWWLLASIFLGAIFLVGQGLEYSHLLRNHVTISRDLFGTTFFTLTGFHGFHVLVGLLMLAILAGLAFFGREREPTLEATGVVAIYWHFVDAVWIVIFGVVYMWSVFA